MKFDTNKMVAFETISMGIMMILITGGAGKKFRPVSCGDRRLSQIFTPAKYKN